jgi:putative SOS response-associated peptidase YedK
MCGRFVQDFTFETLQQNFNIRAEDRSIVPNFNVAPTQEILTIIKHENENTLERLHWGLVPFWTKDVSIGSRMINARVETVASKPSFRNAFKKRRCLIPAGGFYEWKGEKGQKQPYYITIPSGEPFAFAGLWESWTDKEGDDDSVCKSCTIITTSASESIVELHNRMPVILDPDVYEQWLHVELQDAKQLEPILNDGIVHDLKYYQVSTFVNSVKNNDPNCIKPIEL